MSSPTPNDDKPEESPSTHPEVKSALQELIRQGYLDEQRKPTLFKNTLLHEAALRQALEPLDLTLRLDTHRGLALLTVVHNSDPDTEWSHPLIRRQRLNLEQSLLVALLRQAFLLHEQEAGVGQSIARMTVQDLLAQFLTYYPDSGSDNRNESRLNTLLDQLKAHGIVSEVDKNLEFIIRPLIVHMANSESLVQLLQTYQSTAQDSSVTPQDLTFEQD